jgi:plastocyanin
VATSAAIAGSAVAALIVCVPVIARAGDAGRPGGAVDKRAWVRVMDNFYDPRSIGIAEGTKVTFVWKGSNRHNVRFSKVPAGETRKGSKILRHGRWSRTFSQPGLYRYACTLFSGMSGTITVNPPASNTSGRR